MKISLSLYIILCISTNLFAKQFGPRIIEEYKKAESFLQEKKFNLLKKQIIMHPEILEVADGAHFPIFEDVIKNSPYDIIEFIIEQGALKINLRHGHNPLVWTKDHNIIKLLLKKGGKELVNIPNDSDGLPEYPLLRADPEMTKLYLEYGADVYAVSFCNHTALNVAIGLYERSKTLEEQTKVLLLLKAADDPERLIFKTGRSAFFEACWHGNIPFVKYCLDNYPDSCKKVNSNNANILSQIIRRIFFSTLKDHLQIMQLLIDNGIDINQQDKFGDTPLHRACYYGILPEVELLIKAGADTTLKNKKGLTPLEYAKKSLTKALQNENYQDHRFIKQREKIIKFLNMTMSNEKNE